jgi:hypothetical protein
VPERAFPDIVVVALEHLRSQPENEVAEDILAYCSLQSVRSLHPHLDNLFNLAPNRRTYYACWPWRESGTLHFAYLRNVLEHDTEIQRRLRAWEALLETREPEAMQLALGAAQQIGAQEQAHYRLLGVGFEATRVGFRRLYAETVYHIIFPPGYVPVKRQPLMAGRNFSREHHPTWQPAATEAPRMRFGGDSSSHCAYCGEALQHIITVEPIPVTLPISGLERLELSTCLSCLGMEQPIIFYTHGQTGRPQQTEFAVARAKPEFAGEAFLPTEVQITQLSQRWHWQDHALSNGRENLHRIGGAPCWIQGPDYPTCPECGELMMFLFQVDSYLPTVEGNEWMWGDAGMYHCFWCYDCKVSGHLWQCY